MLLAVLSGFIFAIALFAMEKKVLMLRGLLTTALPLSLFVYFTSLSGTVVQEQNIMWHYEWVPSLGIHLDFYLDGLSLLFSLLITGIGTLVFFYTSSYLKGHPNLVRFYIFLSVFMASMLGVVLADNLITLFIFWELTSISSFFLIGFNHDQHASRKSALNALAITGIGGMGLLAFSVWAGSLTGTYSIQEMLHHRSFFNEGPATIGLLVLILSAAFTKSAQFPFHFWLPGAMKAPTPVSTYLHSATMVKAGVYLLLRFSPHFAEHPFWHETLMIFGGFTMIYAGYQTLFKTDLKGILAYSTIGALGILVFLTGIGSQEALTAAILFILVHALYKATLFLITGIIDHQTHTRDISKLNGLRKIMPIVFVSGTVVALSSAGFPPTLGFVGKDLIYEATLHSNLTILLTVVAIVTNIFMVYAGFLVGVKPFVGNLPTAIQGSKPPGFRLWLPTTILAALSVLLGLFPFIADFTFVRPFLQNFGFTEFHPVKLWHGFNLVLLLSFVTILVGLIVYYFLKPTTKRELWFKRFDVLSPKTIIEKASNGFQFLSLKTTKLIQNGYLRNYILVLVLCVVAVLTYHIFVHGIFVYDFSTMTPMSSSDYIILGVMITAIGFSIFIRSRLAAIAGMGVVGYSMCFIFVFYSAPDLAMTQFSIDTLTVILFVLVLYRLPKYLKLSNLKVKIRDLMISLFLGTLISLITLEIMFTPGPIKETSEFYIENAYHLAHGKNIVNVILVDFRGIDTLIEIIVLTIAAIGVFGLLKLNLKNIRKE